MSLDEADTVLSADAHEAERHAPGVPGDAVVWEAVEARTNESVEPGIAFAVVMVVSGSSRPSRSSSIPPARRRDGRRSRVRAGRRPVRRDRDQAQGTRAALATALAVVFPLVVVLAASAAFRANGLSQRSSARPTTAFSRLIATCVAGTVTLIVQRAIDVRRRQRHRAQLQAG